MASPTFGKLFTRTPNIEAFAIALQGNVRTDMAVSAVATQSAPLDAGIYDVWVTVDTYLKVDAVANDVTNANGYLVKAGAAVCLVISDTDRIGAVATGAGVLSYHKVN